jgi:hypothetical protein
VSIPDSAPLFPPGPSHIEDSLQSAGTDPHQPISGNDNGRRGGGRLGPHRSHGGHLSGGGRHQAGNINQGLEGPLLPCTSGSL